MLDHELLPPGESLSNYLIGPVEERSKEGLSLTGEAWRGRLSQPARLLAFAALLRVFTVGQAARYVCDGNASACCALLRRMICDERTLGWLEVKMPGACKGGGALVCYLTTLGFKALKRITPKLARHARPHCPARGVSRERIPHDLYVTEAYLHVHRHNMIDEFHPERTIKAWRLDERRRRAFAGDSGDFSEAMGDFTVLITPRAGMAGTHRVECEVALRLSREQIERKPDGLRWFTATRQKADVVRANKSVDVTVLNDPRIPQAAERELRKALGIGDGGGSGSRAPHQSRPAAADEIALARAKGGSPRLERSVLDLLGVLKAATAGAVAGAHGVDRTGVSRCLSRLEDEGVVGREDVQLLPGRERGRPARLYHLRGAASLTLEERKRYYAASLLVVALARGGFRVEALDAAAGVLVMRHRWDTVEAPLVALVDDEALPVGDVAKRYAGLRARHTGAGAHVIVGMSDEGRMAKLRSLDAGANIVNVARRA